MENCTKCGMPLDKLHTSISCQTNQELFDISMGMYSESNNKDNEEDQSKNHNSPVIVLTILVLLIIIWILKL